MSNGAADLGALLDTLSELASGQDRQQVSAMRERLGRGRFRVLVVGEAKRGKSTLVNALLGGPLLPTGATPVTALPTVVRHGEPERLQVTYLDGGTGYRPAADLPGLVTEAHNPDNRLRLAEVVVHTPAPSLRPGVDLVDTPGVGSVFAHSAAAATAALDTMDAALFVLSADPPISGSERAFLAQVRDRSVALFCVLNKVDNLDPGERTEVIAFTAGVLADTLGRPAAIYPVSARRALAAHLSGDPDALAASGLPALRDDLAAYLADRRSTALVASVGGHAARLATRLLDEATLTRRAAQLSATEAGEQVARFTERLAALDGHLRDATDVARASTGRLLADLNAAAAADTPRLTGDLLGAVATWLDAQPDLPAARLEDQARAHCVTRIEAAVDAWRTARESAIVDGLAAVDARLAAALQHQIQQVRRAARDLLGVDLAIPVPAGRLLPEVGVSYAFGEEIGTTVQWEAALRRHLPGRWGRRAVGTHLLDEVDRLVGQQIGRVRSKLQEALRPATSALIRAVEARYTDATAGLARALAAARAVAGSPAGAAALAGLDARVTTLHRLVEALTGLRDPQTPARSPAGGA